MGVGTRCLSCVRVCRLCPSWEHRPGGFLLSALEVGAHHYGGIGDPPPGSVPLGQ